MSREIFGKSSGSALTGLLTHYTRNPSQAPLPAGFRETGRGGQLFPSGSSAALLVIWGFRDSYRATARGARPDTKGQLPVGRRYDRTRLPCFSDGRLGPVSA